MSTLTFDCSDHFTPAPCPSLQRRPGKKTAAISSVTQLKCKNTKSMHRSSIKHSFLRAPGHLIEGGLVNKTQSGGRIPPEQRLGLVAHPDSKSAGLTRVCETAWVSQLSPGCSCVNASARDRDNSIQVVPTQSGAIRS